MTAQSPHRLICLNVPNLNVWVTEGERDITIVRRTSDSHHGRPVYAETVEQAPGVGIPHPDSAVLVARNDSPTIGKDGDTMDWAKRLIATSGESRGDTQNRIDAAQ